MKNKIIIPALLLCSFFINKSWGQVTITGGDADGTLLGTANSAYSLSVPASYSSTAVTWTIESGPGNINGSNTNMTVSIFPDLTYSQSLGCVIILKAEYTAITGTNADGTAIWSTSSVEKEIEVIYPYLDAITTPVYPKTTTTVDLKKECEDVAFPKNYSFTWVPEGNFTCIPSPTTSSTITTATLSFPSEDKLAVGQLSSGYMGNLHCTVNADYWATKEIILSNIPFRLNTPVISGNSQLTQCQGVNQVLTYSITSPFNSLTQIHWILPSSSWTVSGPSTSTVITVNTNGNNLGGNVTAQVTFSNTAITSDAGTFFVTPKSVTTLSVQSVTNVSTFSYTVAWSIDNSDAACAGVNEYRIMSNGVVLATASGITTRTCNVTLSPCSSYHIYVVAYNSSSYNVGSSSNSVPVTTPLPPPAPMVINSAVPAQGINIGGAYFNSFTTYEIDLNPGFSYTASGSNSFTLIGSNILSPCPSNMIITRSNSVDSSSTALTPSTKASAISSKSSAQQTQQQTQKVFPKTVTSATASNVVIYPNPTNDKINLSILNFAGSAQIAVYDFSGNQVYSTTSSTSQTVIDLSSYPAGIYLINITSGKISKTVKVIRN